jgi:hypothetical protein
VKRGPSLEELEGKPQAPMAKRDLVAAFILALEAQSRFSAEEIRRLQARKNVFDRVAERLKGYVVGIIEKLGSDEKGNLRKLEGQISTMSARACPASLLLIDEALVPLEYKRVTVTMAATDWERCKDRVLGAAPFEVAYFVDNAAVKGALMGPAVPCETCGGVGMVKEFIAEVRFEGEERKPATFKPAQCPKCGGRCSVSPTVAGADLLVGRYTLQVK